MLEMMSGANDDVNSSEIIEAVVKAIRRVLQGHRWAPAFEKNGFGEKQGIRQSLMTEFQWTNMAHIPDSLPSYEQFVKIFPAGCEIPFKWLLSPVASTTEPLASVPARRPHNCIERETLVDLPWNERLRPRRSQSHISLKPTGASGAASSHCEHPCPPPTVPPPLPPPPEPMLPAILVRARRLPPMPRRESQEW